MRPDVPPTHATPHRPGELPEAVPSASLPDSLPPSLLLETGAQAQAASLSPLPVLQLPRVSVRTVKVVNSLGHECALQLLPSLRETLAPPAPTSWIGSLCDLLFSVGLRNLGDGHPVFIDVTEDLLLGPQVELLDPSWAIVQLPAQIRPGAPVIERLRQLHARGYQFSLACLGPPSSRVQALVDLVQWIQVDIATCDRSALLALWSELAERRVYLRGIDRLEVFREYRALGVHAYSGALLSRPVTLSGDQLPVCHEAQIHRLRARLASGADDAELAALLSESPALALRLMILACDGLDGRPRRPDSLLDLMASLRGPLLTVWLDALALEARTRPIRTPASWAERAVHLSRFMALLTERLAPTLTELHQQAALLGLVAHFRMTLPERMAGGAAMPLMSPALEDAWIRRQCLLGAVLDIGLRLMSGGEPGTPATAIADLFTEVGQWVTDIQNAAAVPASRTAMAPRRPDRR